MYNTKSISRKKKYCWGTFTPDKRHDMFPLKCNVHMKFHCKGMSFLKDSAVRGERAPVNHLTWHGLSPSSVTPRVSYSRRIGTHGWNTSRVFTFQLSVTSSHLRELLCSVGLHFNGLIIQRVWGIVLHHQFNVNPPFRPGAETWTYLTTCSEVWTANVNIKLIF